MELATTFIMGTLVSLGYIPSSAMDIEDCFLTGLPVE